MQVSTHEFFTEKAAYLTTENDSTSSFAILKQVLTTSKSPRVEDTTENLSVATQQKGSQRLPCVTFVSTAVTSGIHVKSKSGFSWEPHNLCQNNTADRKTFNFILLPVICGLLQTHLLLTFQNKIFSNEVIDFF